MAIGEAVSDFETTATAIGLVEKVAPGLGSALAWGPDVMGADGRHQPT